MANADPQAPMSSAPMKYLADGSVDWQTMWESFCVLAQAGGPPHRGTRLEAPLAPDPSSDAYRHAATIIMRGIDAVSHLPAAYGEPGWIAITCESDFMAHWLCGAINQENVAAATDGCKLLVPVAAEFRLEHEIKSVITVVAKTTHYWTQMRRWHHYR